MWRGLETTGSSQVPPLPWGRRSCVDSLMAWAQIAGTLRATSPPPAPEPKASHEPSQRLWLRVRTMIVLPSPSPHLALHHLCWNQVGMSDSGGSKSAVSMNSAHRGFPDSCPLTDLGRRWVSPQALASAEDCVPGGLWCCLGPELTALGVGEKLCSLLLCGVVSTQPLSDTLAKVCVGSPDLSSPCHTPGCEAF